MIKLTFLGTKGEIEEFTEKHQYHSSLLLEAGGTRLLIDYGKLRKYSLEELQPDAIAITHAHPDHYAWLNEPLESSVPVYLTQESYDYGKYKPVEPRIIKRGEPFSVGPFEVLPYGVLHSTRCPAVGFKLQVEGKTLIYNSDLVDMINKGDLMPGTDLYIGDGSSIKANLVRKPKDTIIGHTRMITQINWCKRYRVPGIIFTHLGKETLAGEEGFSAQHPEAILAYDGMQFEL